MKRQNNKRNIVHPDNRNRDAMSTKEEAHEAAVEIKRKKTERLIKRLPAEEVRPTLYGKDEIGRETFPGYNITYKGPREYPSTPFNSSIILSHKKKNLKKSESTKGALLEYDTKDLDSIVTFLAPNWTGSQRENLKSIYNNLNGFSKVYNLIDKIKEIYNEGDSLSLYLDRKEFHKRKLYQLFDSFIHNDTKTKSLLDILFANHSKNNQLYADISAGFLDLTSAMESYKSSINTYNDYLKDFNSLSQLLDKKVEANLPLIKDEKKIIFYTQPFDDAQGNIESLRKEHPMIGYVALNFTK